MQMDGGDPNYILFLAERPVHMQDRINVLMLGGNVTSYSVDDLMDMYYDYAAGDKTPPFSNVK